MNDESEQLNDQLPEDNDQNGQSDGSQSQSSSGPNIPRKNPLSNLSQKPPIPAGAAGGVGGASAGAGSTATAGGAAAGGGAAATGAAAGGVAAGGSAAAGGVAAAGSAGAAAGGGAAAVGFFATPPGWIVIALGILLLLFLFIYLKLGQNSDQNVTVRLEKSAPPQVGNGEPINYSLKVSYSGNPTQIIVTDPIPDNATFINAGQNAVTLDAGGNPTTDPAAVKTVRWVLKVSGSNGTTGPGSSSGAGCKKVSDPPGSDWAQINSLDATFVQKVDEVEKDLGQCVPINLIKALVYLESGGAILDPNGAGSGGGYRGVMQVDTNSWCDHTKYNVDTTDGNIGCGISHLAHTYKDQCNTWEGSVTAYYAGHCIPDGTADSTDQGGSGKSDAVYTAEIIDRWHAIDLL